MTPNIRTCMTPNVRVRVYVCETMPTVKGVTAQFLSRHESRFTRYRYRRDIQLWRRFCAETDRHALDGSVDAGQAFWHWMEAQYPVMSCKTRFSGVVQWFDALVEGRIVKGHGLRQVKKTPTKRYRSPEVRRFSDDEIIALMEWFRRKSPRYEWFVGMVAYCGLDCGEVLRIRSSDVRYWDGRCLVKVVNRHGRSREVPVSGRLEVLTLGLSEIYGPTVPLCGVQNSQYVIDLLKLGTQEVLGKRITFLELKRWAVWRQYDRGVPIPVLAKWLGHRTEKWVRMTLRVDSDVWATKPEDVFAAIDTAIDGHSHGSGQKPDSLLTQDFSPTPYDGDS